MWPALKVGLWRRYFMLDLPIGRNKALRAPFTPSVVEQPLITNIIMILTIVTVSIVSIRERLILRVELH
jgi:hypothetical protein